MFSCHKSAFLRFSKPRSDRRVYIRPGAIVAVEDMSAGESKIVSSVGNEIIEDVVSGTAESIIKQILDDQEDVSGYVSLGKTDPEAELKRREEEAERMGRAIARGAKKGQDEADRESWGNP